MNKNKENRMIIDITQLVHWGGNLTGIPRVMYEIASRYSNDDSSVFVVWDKKSNCFYELDIKKSLYCRGQGIFYRDNLIANSNEGMIKLKNGFNYKLKSTYKKLKRYSPSILNNMVSQYGDRISTNTRLVIKPGAGDSLFVLWGEWADKSYQTAVVDAKVGGARLIHIVYDLLPIVTPQYSGHSTLAMHDYYSMIMPICDLVLSISEYTKRDLSEWLTSRGLVVPCIKSFRLGDDFQISNTKNVKNDGVVGSFLNNNKKFILCVGTVEVRKNHTLLYYVYKLAKERGLQLPKLAIVGRRGWKTDDIFDTISNDPDVCNDIIFMQDVSDDELSFLYKSCIFSIYPSFYEGWGLPIAESIAYGKPCLSSNTSSMPEVAGDLINYFSPCSTDECLAAINQLLSEDGLKKAIDKIVGYKTTYWDDTYKQVDNYIKESYVAKS